MGGIREEGAGVRDMQAVPQLKCKEIACWFDDDFRALDIYCEWKRTGVLEMHPRLCREFRRAWCRYFVRMKPLDVRVPKWLRSNGDWTGVSVEYQRRRGVL